MTIRVVVADDHEVVRCGLRSLLGEAAIQIVAEATNGQQTIELVRVHKPDVLLADIRFPDLDGLTAMDQIRQEHPELRIVVFTAYDNPTYVARSIALGASEYLLKNAALDQIVAAIHAAYHGTGPADGSLLHQVKRVLSRRYVDHEGIPLTKREWQVLRHVALGLSNREIASALEISIETVKEHVQNMLRKLRVNDRTQAAVWAVRRGLGDSDDLDEADSESS